MSRPKRPSVVIPAAVAWTMAIRVVTDEWPKGLVQTVPTRKGTVKLLMQDPPRPSDERESADAVLS